MAKLCPRGKAAAKRKFKVYPSAYANMYASAVCSGKVTPGGKKRKKKAEGGKVENKKETLKERMQKAKEQRKSKQKRLEELRKEMKKGGIAKGCGRVMNNRRKKTKYI